MSTPTQLDYNDAPSARAAAELLRRHNNFEAEANITSAARDFLIAARLARSDEIREENPPSDGSRRAVDLTALDTLVEVKRRIGNGPDPNPEHVQQLDDYLAQSQSAGKGVRMGLLTDGKYWLLRWPHAGPVQTAAPYVFTLEDPGKWYLLYEWLRDRALVSLENTVPDREGIEEHFGPNSPSYQRDIDALAALYRANSSYETIEVKRRLWHDLLRTALGEIARTPEQLDNLFVRHTYLGAVIGLVVQASFGIDINRKAETDPADLLQGREFRSATGLTGVLESDFFAWPAEVGGLPVMQTLARRVARFDWQSAPTDIAAILYETVIPPEERRQLGEYYTPAWLARAMTRELVADPLNQRVLDPACGAFIAEAVKHFIEAASQTDLHPKQVLDRLRVSVTGIDVHPVAAHLARAAWTLAARPAIEAAQQAGFDASMSIPVYLGDSLQLRFRAGDMFAEREVRIQVDDERNTELVFPVSLVERAEDFDALMGDVAECIERGEDPHVALDDNHITDPSERQPLQETIETLKALHAEGRDHIWAYYTRNLVRPVALARSKVDVIIGNPPWLNYNQTVSVLRTELERQSKELYGIWAGGRYASNQDVAGLFFARSVDLYLKDGGVIGMVMPHSALQSGQYAKWRTGAWKAGRSGREMAVNFSYKTAWDLEKLEPNTFFPIPASVAFAERLRPGGRAQPLAGEVERWLGKSGAKDVRRVGLGITDTSVGDDSPYAEYAREGASIYPRCLFFVNETENSVIIRAGRTVTVNPRRGSNDRSPWKDLNLDKITGQTIETAHLFNAHLGETLAPYAMLDPLKVVLPLKHNDARMPSDTNGVGGVRLGGLERRMRQRWQTISDLWDENKASATRLSLLENLDHYGKLSSQLEWRNSPGVRPVRVVYSAGGRATAAILNDDDALVDNALYWITCRDIREANYLLAIINSQALYEAVQPLMSKGQFGARNMKKLLWKLPIPEYDPANPQHAAISAAGERAAQGAARQLERLRQERGVKLTVTIARRELRKWLRESEEGATVETEVRRLLGGG